MYSIEPIDLTPRGTAASTQLLRLVFPHSRYITEEYLNWEYNLNPVGKAVGFNAWYQGQLAAHYVTQPIVSLIQGEETKGVLSINTATHPEHRGKKLFTTLADATYQRAKELGYAFVIGVSNANSTPGFVRRLGFKLILPLVANLGFGKTNYPQSREDAIIPAYERMWTKELLNWRLENPAQNYTIREFDDKFIIEGDTGKLGIRVVLGGFDRSLFPEVRTSTRNTINPLKLWLGIDNSIDWRNSWYYTIPARFRPSPLNLIFKNLTGCIELDSTDIKFQAIDFDVY